MIIDAKLLAFFILLAVQVVVSIVYKFSQKQGTYEYSPLSVIASAEFIKLWMSFLALLCTTSIDSPPISAPSSMVSSQLEQINRRLLACWMLLKTELCLSFIVATGGLALLYAINNQLAFVLFLYVDIASISMFKSFSSFASAILLWAFFERQVTREQWASIILQVIGLCIVQYDGCKNIPILAWKHYLILTISTLITAISSVVNERLIKTYAVNIHIQNGILYTFGLILNLSLFFLIPNIFDNSSGASKRKHFFEGYSLLVLAIIAANSLLGIVITFVYKYADAIVKTFSTACATGVLIYINVAVFHGRANLTVYLGAIVVFVSSYLFLLAKPEPSMVAVKVGSNEPLIKQEREDAIQTKANRWKYFLICILLPIIIFYSIKTASRHVFSINLTKNFYVLDRNVLNEHFIRIDNLSLNYPIVMRGKNLCSTSGSSLNLTTEFIIHGHLCSPLELCSSTMVSCYLQGGLHRKSIMGDQINVSLIRYDQGTKTPKVMMNSTVPFYRGPLSHWEKNHIALIIHFNQPFYARLPLFDFYHDLFPKVAFTGPESHPNVIECPEGYRGFKAYECLSRAVTSYPNYTGYLMIHFDLLPFLHNLEKLNVSSVWIPEFKCVASSDANGWYWWSQGMGLRAINQTLNEINILKLNVTNYTLYASNYHRNAGDRYCEGYADIYYLPRRFASDWIPLSHMFNRNDVFLEIAFPSITQMIIPDNSSSNLAILSGVTFGQQFSSAFLSKNPLLHYIHRLDLSSQSQQELIELMVRKSYLS